MLLIGFATLIAIGIGLFFVFKKKKIPPPSSEPTESISTPAPVVEKPAAVAPPKKGLSDKLYRTREGLFGRLSQLFSGTDKNQQALLDELEEVLLGSDVGVKVSSQLISKVKDQLRPGNTASLNELVLKEAESLFEGLPHGIPSFSGVEKPAVVFIVGINGAGKTTTIGKLAERLIGQGKTVLMGACDTFRAAAIDQLRVWSERTGAQFVPGREGGDPGAVAFDAVTAGKARGVDVVLLDTAGRLHTKTNLMEELKKVQRVIKKVIPEAPHETWLVIDGTSGQNALQQAKEFHQTLGLTGVLITKLDGTAKGGAILAVAGELRLPIKCIGVGESAEDLIPFDPHAYLQAILQP